MPDLSRSEVELKSTHMAYGSVWLLALQAMARLQVESSFITKAEQVGRAESRYRHYLASVRAESIPSQAA